MGDPIDSRRALPSGAALSEWRAPDGWPLRRLDWRQPGTARGSLLFAGGPEGLSSRNLTFCLGVTAKG